MHSKISEEEKIEQIQTLTSSKDIQSQQINSTRSRIKVQMQGVAIGRAVDLTVLDGYDQLIDELEKSFDLKDELRMDNQWEIVFADDEGDMMLVGDDPWIEFCNIVKKIFILSKNEVKIMGCKNKFSEGGSTLTTTTLTCLDLSPNIKINHNFLN
ncbi:unnamed protein product [Thlaspi arvense]|uniref:Auxin-responsive protein n=1 Tax=Thlaspi arvense TaxID=13288 RepID=A0AAU9SW41_THLAR|nr:unnamed protein product [Thlaspi arvense]